MRNPQSTEGRLGIPHIRRTKNQALYARYEELAKAEPLTVFGGRLGTYKYYDMHQVIDTALTAYEEQVEPLLKK